MNNGQSLLLPPSLFLPFLNQCTQPGGNGCVPELPVMSISWVYVSPFNPDQRTILDRKGIKFSLSLTHTHSLSLKLALPSQKRQFYSIELLGGLPGCCNEVAALDRPRSMIQWVNVVGDAFERSLMQFALRD